MTTIFMVFTCTFLNSASYNLPEQVGQNCYPARWVNYGAPHKFSTIEDCKASIARASSAGIILRDARLHRAFGDDYLEDTKCLSKTVRHGNQQTSASLPVSAFEVSPGPVLALGESSRAYTYFV